MNTQRHTNTRLNAIPNEKTSFQFNACQIEFSFSFSLSNFLVGFDFCFFNLALGFFSYFGVYSPWLISPFFLSPQCTRLELNIILFCREKKY